MPSSEGVCQPIICQIFCRKLHENETIWTERRARIPGAPRLGSVTAFGSSLVQHLLETISIIYCSLKLCNGVSLSRSSSQYINLDDVFTHSCFSKSQAYTSTGGALSMWVRLDDFPSGSGFLSSQHMNTAGFRFYQLSTGSIT